MRGGRKDSEDKEGRRGRKRGKKKANGRRGYRRRKVGGEEEKVGR